MALESHQKMGEKLMIYTGLVLYIKEMDDARYQKLCSVCLSSPSALIVERSKGWYLNLKGLYVKSQSAASVGDERAFDVYGITPS